MRRKRNLVTNEITKYKARLNVHGGKQTFSVNYVDTYTPVVTWFAIRLLIICAIVLHWKLRKVDFIMAAPIECDMYLQLLDGIETETGNNVVRYTYSSYCIMSTVRSKHAAFGPIYYLRIFSRLASRE